MSNEISMSNVVSNAMDTLDTMDTMDTMDREWMLCFLMVARLLLVIVKCVKRALPRAMFGTSCHQKELRFRLP